MQVKFAAKLTVVFGLTTICVTTFAIGLLYNRAQSAVYHEIEAKLIDVALGASQLVDPHTHASIRSQRSIDYQKVRNALQRLRKANPRLIHIYTLVRADKSDPTKLKFVVDIGGEATPLARLGCPLDASYHPAMLAAFARSTADLKLRRDKYGSWFSSYAPIRDSNGRAIAIIGVDMDADYILREERSLGIAATLAFGVAVALAILLSLIVSSRISSPVRQLTTAIRHISEGNLDYTISIDSRDEIGEMASSFNQMVSSLKESQNRLLKKANTDGLTGLYNHRYFQERLSQELKRAIRYTRPLALIMIDVDGFKAINDSLGHPAGDTILRKVADTITQNIREIDIATRYGGDEFTIILPETDLDEAVQTAERIRRVFDSQHVGGVFSKAQQPNQSHSPNVTLSIGVAVCPKHARQRDSLLAAADIAMYHAKHTSQNAVCSYDSVPGAGSSMDPCRIHSFLQSASVSTIAALAAAVDAKDHYTKGHSEAVAKYAVGIADELHMSDEDKFSVRIAALLHDVGKIGMPDTILKKAGSLTTEQRDIVRSHPSVGESIVKQVPQLQRILPGILYHHERFDGTGYPCGLTGSRIPLLARIICVADSFDAMTSTRPYREAMSHDKAVAELSAGADTQFDRRIVEALVNWLQAEGQAVQAA
ncbi:MAG: diguanylate cyclase [Armatimonadota bacterium]|nr:diguanylate cyclase [Armatimonadota bacterium]